ncbi:MAG: hypothetical protein ACI9LY_002591 [Arenicella sp.]
MTHSRTMTTRDTLLFRTLGITIGLLVNLLLGSAALGQLPELAQPSAATGAPTTARFFSGSSPDSGSTFANTFPAEQPVTILTEIQVEAAHVNSVGNTYLLIVLNGLTYMRVESGNYEVWDGTLAGLKASFPEKTLQASEKFTVLESIALGAAGLAGTNLSIYLAYDSVAMPGELYYSGVPMSLTIEPVSVATAPSFQLFIDTISAPITQSLCIACHTSTGIASAALSTSRIQYLTSIESGFQQNNYDVLVNYIKNVPTGASLILSKPLGVDHLGAAQLSSSSDQYHIFEDFVKVVLSE